MGRRPNKSRGSRLIGGVFKLALVLALVFGLSYGVSLSITALSEMSLGRVYVKTLPYSEVLGKYVSRVSPSVNSLGENLGIGSDNKDSDGKDTEGSGTEDGDAAGELGSASSTTNIDVDGFTKRGLEDSNQSSTNNQKTLKVTIGLLADSHNDNDNLQKASQKAKELGAESIIYLGDFSSWGAVSELSAAKKVLDESGVEYFSIPGDHDIAQSKGPSNFVSVFGSRYRTQLVGGVRFIMVDNSDNYGGVDKDQLSWLTDELERSKDQIPTFLAIGNPLYNSDGFRLMGENSETVKQQADLLLRIIRNSSVKAIFSGDNHLSSRSADPEKQGLEHIVVGALTKERNLQSARFSMLYVYEDGTYKYEEVVL